MAFYNGWAPYVPVAKRRANAKREMDKLRKKGQQIDPIEVEGRKIAGTFWGKGWCDHLEQFSDFENRLPRGRTYVRNGSVCHLAVTKGQIEAIVSGSELYRILIKIIPLSARKWKAVRQQCAGQIGSMLELLQGRLSGRVMEIVTHQKQGLFPLPEEIRFSCSCPDWAAMCKHIAAVLYGVGARLDQRPELLFLLRNVDHEQLISAELDLHSATSGKGKRRRLAGADLSDVFDIDIEETPTKRAKRTKTKVKKKATKRPAAVRERARRADSKATSKAKHPSRKKTVAKKPVTKTTKPNKPTTSISRDGTTRTKTQAIKPFTGAAVKRLRRQLDLSRAEFAEHLEVSPPTVTNWEKKQGKLNLQQRTLEALNKARLDLRGRMQRQ